MAGLHALGEAHDLLTAENWDRALLNELVGRALKPFAPCRRDRIIVDGPPITFPAKTSLMLTMCLHELATNAVKYGVLSNGTGRVNVDWELVDNGQDRKVRLSWHESGGPSVVAPKHIGFSSLLIERSFSGNGETYLEFLPDGLRCTLELSLH